MPRKLFTSSYAALCRTPSRAKRSLIFFGANNNIRNPHIQAWVINKEHLSK